MRLVASDLDGTIVRADGSISARTVAALAACEERGVQIVFATGRPIRWMPPIVAATGHRGQAICGNGAVVYDLGEEVVVRTRTLTREAVLATVHALRAVLGAPSFALETLVGFRREAGYVPRHEVAVQSPVGTVEDLLDDDPPVLKLLCRVEDGSHSDHLLALARAALDGVAEPVHSGMGGLLEISALGVSKASTLAMLAAERGIDPADVVAFGDMPNDVPMLRWAGRGYAMASGHHEAIDAADHVAPPCEEDGVAQVIERLLAQR